MSRIVSQPRDGEEIDCKRFKLPGLVIETECPGCGKKHVVEPDYLSYPIVGQPYSHFIYCDDCETEWAVTLILNISLTLAD